MLGISWLAYLLFGLGFAAIAFAFFAPNREARPDADDGVKTAASPALEQFSPTAVAESPADLVFKPARITWPSLVDGSEAEVPLEARVRMIEGLGSLGESWCGPILVAAYLEEEEAQAREVVLAALHEARYRDCGYALEAASHSPHLNERILAVELADAIDALAALNSALTDPELAVASAAAYALRKRMNGSVATHLERYVSRERAEQLLDAIHVLT